MDEFAFELQLCAHLERGRESIVSRQLGGHVAGRRILDTVLVEPGPNFADRAAITPYEIPEAAIESSVGPGEARYWKTAFDCHPERAREAVDRAREIGFFESERRNGREYVRQTARYPKGWFGRITAIENKPDLSNPGALETQLLTDVALGLCDAVVLATASHVTGAHLNRIPDAVGVWRYDPETDEYEVIREATPLDPDAPAVEILDRSPARTDVALVSAAQKRRARRRLAERAYGKGWRTFDAPACACFAPDEDGLPYCAWADALVHPTAACGPTCDGCEAGPAPPVDGADLRADRTPWEPSPAGGARTQAGLDRYD